MSYCEGCTDPLVVITGDTSIVNGESSTGSGNVRVVDDIELICGHHFHWSCFSDAYKAGAKSNCPKCNSNIIDFTTNKLLVIRRTNSEEQLRYDLGAKLEEEGTNPESMRIRAFLDTCASGDNHAITSMLAVDQSLVVSQDFETAQTCLHVAVRSGRYDTVSHLISRGADRNARDSNGETFIDLARQLGASEDVLSKLRNC